jgi:lysylphosphatidylglycerol synthetase-like protein (DUF2156 family)
VEVSNWREGPIEERSKSNWRILKTLSNAAFYVFIVIQVLSFYHEYSWDESLMDNPAAGAVWLQRRHLYLVIGMVAFALSLIFRISWWIIEYVDGRQLITNKED